ncbi:MAG TPA: redoxin domain-containing protein [Bacteriovoracaceae bacterium]|nr:redoxin domain-containing protein [Bacteriovoracaceae bacterium]
MSFIFGSLLLLMGTVFAQHPQGELGEVNSQLSKTFVEKMPKEVVQLYNKNIKDLKATGIEKKSLKVGENAPDVQLTIAGEKVSLSKIYAVKPVVLKFYRGGWCPYCVAEMRHYEALNRDFKKADSQIVGVSPDTTEMSAKTQSKNELTYDLVSDEGHAIARKFGLVYKADSKVVEDLKKNGIDLTIYQGNNSNELSIPATYVIGKDGKIAFAFVDADFRVRAEPSKVLQVVKSLKK